MLQQSTSAIVISPVITANLAPSRYHIKDQYSLKNLVVKNMTHAPDDTSTFSLVGYTSMPEGSWVIDRIMILGQLQERLAIIENRQES